MPRLTGLERVEELELAIDGRLVKLREELFRIFAESPPEGPSLDAMQAVTRAAYGKGYCDSLADDRAGQRGKLCYDHGFKIPGETRPK